MEAMLQNYWMGMVMAILATSLLLSVLNQFEPLKTVNNLWLVLIGSVLFTFLTMSFSGIETLGDIQATAFKFIITVLVCVIFSRTKGQTLVDRFIVFLFDKISGIFGGQSIPPPDEPKI